MIENKPNAFATSVFTSASRAIDGAISRMVQGVNAGSWNAVAEVDRFRLVRERTLALLGQVSGEQALWSPRKGVWSLAQIADHLLLSEEMYREQFRRLFQTAKEGRGSTIEISLKEVNVGFAAIPREVIPLLEVPIRMFNLFVPHAVRETMVRYPLIAALNPQSSEPREGLTIGKLREDLAAALAETERFFRAPMPRNIHQLTINHPIMGNNTVPQLFGIMIAHEQRHQEQMSAVREHVNFPKAPREPMSAAQLTSVFGKSGT
ncbi:MAG: DinB family protein [Bryobacteraceae bacterium]